MQKIEPQYKKLGQLIYEARLKKGYTTNELCQEFKKRGLVMQRTSITHIECGNQRVMLHYLDVFAEVLELKLKDILQIFVEAK